KSMTVPTVTRLDNAALIYPPCLSRRYASLFRMSVTLKDNIDESVLALALKRIIPRFPSFAYKLDKGFFWWYLRKLENDPQIGRPAPLRPFSFKENGGYMFRVSCSVNTIDLDVFHAVTDGTGAMTFLLSLTAEYLRLSRGVQIEYGGYVLDPEDEPVEEEFNDAFRSFSGAKGSLDKDSRAYHIKGSVEPYDVLHNVKLNISTADLSDKARDLGCTVTELLTSLMLKSLQRVHSEDASPFKKKYIRIEVPVNLRKMFGAGTLRNFSSYVYLGLDLHNGAYGLEQIVKEVSLQKRLYTLPGRITTRVAANVALEDNPAIAAIPRVIKKPVMNLINHLKGDSYCSHTLSNMGAVELPEAMKDYVCGIEFMLGRTREKSGSCACVSYDGTTTMNFTRRIRENDFEMYFAEELDACGIGYDMYLF
ncbi:MAG: hypothetical protein KBS67_02040, partial [Bacteroidales bacterium]|nr:hypothetical protein [Candidatus Cryptobacteroides equifaecalis]